MAEPTRSAQILVVEDDPNIAELLDFMLQQDGHRTVIMRDGLKALEHVANAPAADLAILDVMLPYRDGFAVASALRAQDAWKQVPILMLTAKNQPADRARGSTVGVSAYLTKPFEPDDLLARVQQLLEGRP